MEVEARERGSFAVCRMLRRPWRDPLAVLRANVDEPMAFALLSDAREARGWSYFGASPAEVPPSPPGAAGDPLDACGRILGSVEPPVNGAPPFAGGLVGVAAYDLAAAIEPSAGVVRDLHWPTLSAGLYLAVLAFDHGAQEAVAVGRGADASAAHARALTAASWLERPEPYEIDGAALSFDVLRDGAPDDYEAAVAEVVERIARGELFQANIAARWSGALRGGAAPVDLMARLVRRSPAPFAAFHAWPGRALVSHSPERFLRVDPDGRVETQPIKGTRSRVAAPEEDAARARDLTTSVKDRAENLMIVDLMRNDLARASRAGSVEVTEFCTLRSFTSLHHLVSTIQSRLAPGRSTLDLFGSAFPPGSITGAPKVQAMRVIAALEPPRGPFFGSSFWLGLDGALDSNVLIRTIALHEREGAWRWEARAGAGIVADSDPAAEALEVEAKIAAILDALRQAVS